MKTDKLHLLIFRSYTYLSKINTLDSQSLIEGINDDKEEYIQYKKILEQHVQPKPNAMSQALWDIHLQSYMSMNNLTLKVPLGDQTGHNITYGRWNVYQDQNTVYSWVNDDKNWKKYKLYSTCSLESSKNVTEVRYITITPVQIDTTGSDIFVSYSACFNSSKSLKVYGPTTSQDKYVDHQPSWIR